MGPETLAPELLKLDFVGQRGPEPLLDSGFGPYALTRLCYETGGVYFAVHPNRAVGREVTGEETENLAAHFSMFFDGPTMRRYQPDYLPAAEYLRIIRGNRAEQALVEAAQLTWTTQLEDVRLRFAKRDEAQLAQELSQAQRAAAMRQPKIDQLARLLMEGEADRAAIKEPRWQAGFDLALGRVLAAKSRTDGYNLMLAQVKQGRPFKEAKHNTWILRPAEEFASSPLEKTAKRARELLDQVVKDHPGTPWAYFAEQELSTPLGWRWSEGSTKLSPINDNGDNPPPKPERKPPPGPVRRNPPPL